MCDDNNERDPLDIGGHGDEVPNQPADWDCDPDDGSDTAERYSRDPRGSASD